MKIGMLLLKLFQPIVKLQGQAYYCTQFANRGQWNIFIFAQQCCCFLLFGLSFDAMISHQNVSKKVLSQLAQAKVSLKKLLNLGSILLQDLIMTFARLLAHLRVLQDCSNCSFNSRAWLIKFIYSEKATKFCEIFPLLLTGTTQDKSKVKISQNFVVFSEYMNFISQQLLWADSMQ